MEAPFLCRCPEYTVGNDLDLLPAVHDEHEKQSDEEKHAGDHRNGNLRTLCARDVAADRRTSGGKKEPKRLSGEESRTHPWKGRVVRAPTTGGFSHGLQAVFLVYTGLKVARVKGFHDQPHALSDGKVRKESDERTEHCGGGPIHRGARCREHVCNSREREEQSEDAASN